MLWLVLGVLLWSGAHLLPSAGVGARAALRRRLGGGPYRGLFSLVILGSVALIVVGWRATTPLPLYPGVGWDRIATNIGMFVALSLFAASVLPTNLKRLVRHPQLMGVVVWSLAHLLSNGDQRSLVLFGGIGSWALAAIVFTNRRDGAWQRPGPQPVWGDAVVLVAGVIGFALLFTAHPYFTGMPATPR